MNAPRRLSGFRLRSSDPTVIGVSPAISAVRAQLERLEARILDDPSSFVVLIQGESGTGKDVVARYLHRRTRPEAPFVPFNASSVDRPMFMSTLVGHERGAFTSADARREGLLEHAGTGTLFLDEIGDLPLESQASLLRIVETREFTRLGGRETLRFDGLLIVATHVDLGAAVNDRRFRLDLLHRLTGHRIYLPPLRERPEDIPLLAAAFLGANNKRLTKCAVELLQRRAWPGNVRELRCLVEMAVREAESGKIDARLLEQLIEEQQRGLTPILGGALSSATAGSEAGCAKCAADPFAALLATPSPAQGLEYLLERLVQAAVAQSGSKGKAARLLRVSRNTILRKLGGQRS